MSLFIWISFNIIKLLASFQVFWIFRILSIIWILSLLTFLNIWEIHLLITLKLLKLFLLVSIAIKFSQSNSMKFFLWLVLYWDYLNFSPLFKFTTRIDLKKSWKKVWLTQNTMKMKNKKMLCYSLILMGLDSTHLKISNISYQHASLKLKIKIQSRSILGTYILFLLLENCARVSNF